MTQLVGCSSWLLILIDFESHDNASPFKAAARPKASAFQSSSLVEHETAINGHQRPSTAINPCLRSFQGISKGCRFLFPNPQRGDLL